MPSYLVTGASRGLGFGFVQVLSSNPKNTVIGLVRNKAATEKKLAKGLDSPSNVHIFEADITDYHALKVNVVEDVSKITRGAKDICHLVKDFQDSFNINVVGNLHLFNLFTPLVLKGQGKKVIAISSGMSDLDFVRQFEIDSAPAYAISKAGLSVLIAKFAARYAREGVLFMSVCPGSVDSGFEGDLTEVQKEKVAKLGQKFVNYAPDFKGPSTPEDSANAVLKVMHEASLEKGSSGALVSKFGNR
ncbi:protoporphyrinogen oxidase [Fusarium beomiforme]|uniref:Protoporphyrinogen oxidase n=1 Tax=Fusarium beomiforme TaxID=44412 RepID=A0A9P5AAN2_9HYPO|nr:protoporphyrinogen oxidase [Fusarium beomiforme]